MAGRWFIVPSITISSAGNGHYRPKYSDEGELWVGNRFTDPTSKNWPITGSCFIVKVYGTTTQLDNIASYTDTYTPTHIDISQTEIADVMNTTAGGTPKTFAEWDAQIGWPPGEKA